jgi:hypothetical protein
LLANPDKIRLFGVLLFSGKTIYLPSLPTVLSPAFQKTYRESASFFISSSGCEYRSSVVFTDECRMISDTIFGFTLSLIILVARECLAS